MDARQPISLGWIPCLADPNRGIAFFDGITIYTDMVSDALYNRVEAIYEEDQIYVSRRVADHIGGRKGLTVLDIDTSSGIHAIQCAKLGCSVHAIDPSDRAIVYARSNIKLNGLVVGTDMSEGAVFLEQQNLSDLRPDQKFDLILLNTSHTPIKGGLRPEPGINAIPDSGPFGQDQFERQLRIALTNLKEEGKIIGSHMALVDSNGNLELPEELSVDWCRIIEEDIEVTEFWRLLYGDTHSLPEQSKPGWKFCFIYFEIRKPQSGEKALHKNNSKTVSWTGSGPSWKSRIEYHHRLVGSRAIGSSLPTPSLFLDSNVLPVLKEGQALKTPSDSVFAPIMDYLGHWIKQSKLLDADGPFDVIWIDTAPWYPKETGIEDLRIERQVWVNDDAEPAHTGEVGIDPFADRFMDLTNQVTKKLQEDHWDTFLHPALSEHFGDWRPMLFSLRNVSPNLEKRRRYSPLLHNENTGYQTKHHTLALREADINAQLIRENSGTVKHRVLPNLIQFESYHRSRFMFDDFDINEQRRALTVDLSKSHNRMHGELDLALKECNHSEKLLESTLLTVPISISRPTSTIDPNRSDRASQTYYRGCIWIYAAYRNGWAAKAEQQILDLSRLTTLMIGSAANDLAARDLGQIYERRVSAHEIKNLLADLSNWISSSRTNIDGVNYEGKLVLPEIFKAGLVYLKTWTFANSAEDLPFFNDEDPPETFDALLKACWQSAVEHLIFSVVRTIISKDTSSARLANVYGLVARLQDLLNPKDLPESDAALAINWKLPVYISLSRILIHIFRECIQHGSWTEKPMVAVEQDEQIVRLKIRSKKVYIRSSSEMRTIQKNRGEQPGLSSESSEDVQAGELDRSTFIFELAKEFKIDILKEIFIDSVKGEVQGKEVYSYLLSRSGFKGIAINEDASNEFKTYRFEFEVA